MNLPLSKKQEEHKNKILESLSRSIIVVEEINQSTEDGNSEIAEDEEDFSPSLVGWGSNSMNMFYQFVLPRPSHVERNKADVEAIRKILIEEGHIDA